MTPMFVGMEEEGTGRGRRADGNDQSGDSGDGKAADPTADETGDNVGGASAEGGADGREGRR